MIFRPSPIVLLAVVACGSSVAPAAAPPFEASAPQLAPPFPAPDASPTARTPEQKARDDARLPLANDIVDAYGNYSPKFSRDGKRSLFGSNRDGNRQYYLSDVL